MMDNLKRARNRKRGNKPRVDLHITAPVFYSTRKRTDSPSSTGLLIRKPHKK
jgi:hypothetical protein